MTRSLRHSNTGCFRLFGVFRFGLMTGTAEVMTVEGLYRQNIEVVTEDRDAQIPAPGDRMLTTADSGRIS